MKLPLHSLPPLILLLAALTPLRAENSALNADFEAPVNGELIENWDVQTAATLNGTTVTITESEVNSGKQALLLEQPTPIEVPAEALQAPITEKYLRDNNLYGHALVSQSIPVEGGQNYDVRFSYSATGLQRRDPRDAKTTFAYGTVQIFWLTDARKPAGQDYVQPLLSADEDTTGWVSMVNGKPASATDGGEPPKIQAPPDAAFAMLRIGLTTVGPNLTPKFALDDFVFEKAAN